MERNQQYINIKKYNLFNSFVLNDIDKRYVQDWVFNKFRLQINFDQVNENVMSVRLKRKYHMYIKVEKCTITQAMVSRVLDISNAVACPVGPFAIDANGQPITKMISKILP